MQNNRQNNNRQNNKNLSLLRATKTKGPYLVLHFMDDEGNYYDSLVGLKEAEHPTKNGLVIKVDEEKERAFIAVALRKVERKAVAPCLALDIKDDDLPF